MRTRFFLCLTSLVLLLTACGTKPATGAKASSAATSSSQEATSSSSTSTSVSSASSSSASSDAEASPVQETSIDSQAILAGDYSSLVGTWVNDKGEALRIEADGSSDRFDASIFNGLEESEGTLVSDHYKIGGASSALTIVPAGQKLPFHDQMAKADSLVIGTSSEAALHAFTRAQ